MKITIQEIESAIKNILDEFEVLNTEFVYEKNEKENNLKLVLFFTEIYTKKNIAIYTKLIFNVDLEKTYLVKNSFLYLYDINCIYKNKDFEDIDDFSSKFRNILKNREFGKDLKILCEFIENPATSINGWIQNKNLNFSVNNVIFNPNMYKIPCKSLSFSFILSINNMEINLNIRKIKDNLYNFTFKDGDNIINVEKSNLNNLLETIAITLKKFNI